MDLALQYPKGIIFDKLNAMKFLLNEHKAIRNVIESQGLKYDDFFFVKKRGRLSVHYENSDDIFTFFRKKGMELDAEKKFVRTAHFEVDHFGKREEFETWDEVVAAFKLWLTSL